MKNLRQFLAGHIDLQAQFLVQRLRNALPEMLAARRPANGDRAGSNSSRVASTARGCYALVDYVNFKGEGVLATRALSGHGWGLLQVLEGMTAKRRWQGGDAKSLPIGSVQVLARAR